jgi:hypothetical protein
MNEIEQYNEKLNHEKHDDVVIKSNHFIRKRKKLRNKKLTFEF